MHQPDYRDEKGVMQLPWVFLHAIKDYYDMPWMLNRHKNIKATFNITPTLIEQLELYYDNPQKSDKFLSLWLENPAFLAKEERAWVIKIIKTAQFETMVKPLVHFRELYHNETFNDAQLLDLEVLFILSWCGVYLKTHNKNIQYLIKKQQNYSNEDKLLLLKELSKFISGIWKYYKKLYVKKKISISTTPFYHPILPLLLDIKNAKIANNKTTLPQHLETFEDDALLHIQKAQELFSKTFGFKTDIFWPAEGAVDEKSIKLLKSCGINMIATDEAILYKSLSSNDKNLIYLLYNYYDMHIGFRDHRLSDLIGFEYRYKNENEAVNNFMQELLKIEQINQEATVFVILDGENAWEFYKNNGFDFFELLYKEIDNCSWCKMLRMDEIKQLPSHKLPQLLPGSWINGSFDTWIGEREKTRAWELLILTKKDYKNHQSLLSKEKQKKIQKHFLSAECSDWYWWYGSDHYTEFTTEFDALFRKHLISIYRLMDIVPPVDLFIPIASNQNSKVFQTEPTSSITPDINGKRNSFFEWMGCGIVDESKINSTMQKSNVVVKKIYYGQDDKNLYFALEGNIKKLCKKGLLNIILEPIQKSIKIPFNKSKTIMDGIKINMACNEWLEFSIAKKNIKKDKILLRFEIEDTNALLQIVPSFGMLEINLNDAYTKNWFV